MRISICIPTYNRAPFLIDLLESIVRQKGHTCELEVTVSDNASTDDTEAVIERFRPQIERLVYNREAENRGADRNFLKAIAIASGDYCWLMGSDDIVEEGGLARVQRVLEANPGIAGISVENTAYAFALDSIVPKGIDSTKGVPQSKFFDGQEETFENIGVYLGFISAQVFDRKLWQRVVAEFPVDQYFNVWVHVYVIGCMLTINPRWGYVHEPCVGWRSGNDSFLAEGMYRRLEIDVVGFEKVVGDLFGRNSRIYRIIMENILLHATARVRHARATGVSPDFFRKAKPLLATQFRSYSRFWLTCYPLFFIPQGWAGGLRWVYQRTLKPMRHRRANRQRPKVSIGSK
jgi:abequosyltransferase